jgi:hypothetical protein
MWPLILAAIIACGCGRIGFDASDDVASDGRGDSLAGSAFTIAITGARGLMRDVELTPDGGAIVVGEVEGPVALDSTMLPYAGGTADVLVVSIRQDGQIRWAKTFGSMSRDIATGVAVDPNGTIYVVGMVSGPTSFGGPTLTNQNSDGFVVALAPNGDHVWSRLVGGAASDGSFGSDAADTVDVLVTGDLVIGGNVLGDVDFGNGHLTSPGGVANYDGFVAGLSAANGETRWVQRFGVQGYNQVLAVAGGALGEVYAAAYYEGTLDFGGGGERYDGIQDAALLAYTSDGAYRWSRTINGVSFEIANTVAVGGGIVAVGGFFNQTINLPGMPTPNGPSAGLIAAYTTDGVFQWARIVDGADCDDVFHLQASDGELLASATFGGSVDLGDGVRTSAGGRDALLAAIAYDGTAKWTMTLGGAGDDIVKASAGSRSAGLYTVGFTAGTVQADCRDPITNGDGFIRRQ